MEPCSFVVVVDASKICSGSMVHCSDAPALERNVVRGCLAFCSVTSMLYSACMLSAVIWSWKTSKYMEKAVKD